MKRLIRSYFSHLYASVTAGYTRKLLNLLEHDPRAVLVDAGCWDGKNTVQFAERIGTKKPIGLELVESAAKQARKRGIKVIIADLNKSIPLKAGSVDVVVANHVIEHLCHPHVFVQELYRILKPDGYVVLGTPNLASWHNIFALLVGRQPYSGPTVTLSDNDAASEFKRQKNEYLMEEVEDKAAGESALGHIVVITYPTLLKLLKSAGFKVEGTYAFGYHPFLPFMAKFLASIDKRHSHYVIIKARKT